MAELILHQYKLSPYAEKVRAILGYKGLAWRAVEQPMVMPKPALTALTGGYRRIPVLQIGADIFCDTALIAERLEAHQPKPPIFPAALAGQHRAIGAWAERAIFWPVARFTVGMNADRFPMEFHADRAAMWGVAPSVERMKKAAPRYGEQLAALLPILAQMLAASGGFLLGPTPGYADFAAYQCLWFLQTSGAPHGEAFLRRHPAIVAWMERMAALGTGAARPMTPDQALEVARVSSPAGGYDCADEAVLKRGISVSIRPEEFGRESVVGTIVGLGANSITLLRSDEALGEIAVHFPRLGYVIAPA